MRSSIFALFCGLSIAACSGEGDAGPERDGGVTTTRDGGEVRDRGNASVRDAGTAPTSNALPRPALPRPPVNGQLSPDLRPPR